MVIPLVSGLRLSIKKILYRNYSMSKKITIKEEDVDEPYDEIIEQVDNSPPPEPDPTPPPPPEKQKADCKMRMRELYKCDDCGKYLTKKSLNYSHYKTCRGKPENQIKPEPEPRQQTPPPPPPEPVFYQQAPRPIPIHEQMRMERRQAHLDKINRLSMFIA